MVIFSFTTRSWTNINHFRDTLPALATIEFMIHSLIQLSFHLWKRKEEIIIPKSISLKCRIALQIKRNSRNNPRFNIPSTQITTSQSLCIYPTNMVCSILLQSSASCSSMKLSVETKFRRARFHNQTFLLGLLIGRLMVWWSSIRRDRSLILNAILISWFPIL